MYATQVSSEIGAPAAEQAEHTEPKPESAMVYVILLEAKAMLEQEERRLWAKIMSPGPVFEAFAAFRFKPVRLPPRWHRL